MRRHLLTFLQKLEQLIPPPKGGHHSITYAEYGSDAQGWEPRLALHLNAGGFFHTLFFDDSDFEKDPNLLAIEVLGVVENERRQLTIGR